MLTEKIAKNEQISMSDVEGVFAQVNSKLVDSLLRIAKADHTDLENAKTAIANLEVIGQYATGLTVKTTVGTARASDIARALLGAKIATAKQVFSAWCKSRKE